MKYDEAKSRGVQNKGQTGKKVFINRDADYDTALERIREELYGTTKMKVCSVGNIVETVLEARLRNTFLLHLSRQPKLISNAFSFV